MFIAESDDSDEPPYHVRDEEDVLAEGAHRVAQLAHAVLI
jgi:hypothetical protein